MSDNERETERKRERERERESDPWRERIERPLQKLKSSSKNKKKFILKVVITVFRIFFII